MFKKVKNIFYILSISIFVILSGVYYFSDTNINRIIKNRTFYSKNKLLKIENLPILKNDTNNIVEFTDDIETYKKNKKTYSFWGLIGK